MTRGGLPSAGVRMSLRGWCGVFGRRSRGTFVRPSRRVCQERSSARRSWVRRSMPCRRSGERLLKCSSRVVMLRTMRLSEICSGALRTEYLRSCQAWGPDCILARRSVSPVLRSNSTNTANALRSFRSDIFELSDSRSCRPGLTGQPDPARIRSNGS